MRETDQYVFFWGGWPSQWHKCKFFDQDATLYNCAEQYMMAQKARLFGDTAAQARIMAESDPHIQKDVGREVSNFNEDQWKRAAKTIVWRATLFKFTQNVDLKASLLATRSKTLVEASPHDLIWGIGLKWDDPRCDDPTQWQGTNFLGEALMSVRKALIDAAQ